MSRLWSRRQPTRKGPAASFVFDLFDPNQRPDKIRPVIKRKGAKLFAYGECSRAILNALRGAIEPISTAQIVERIALDCRIATETPDIAEKLLALVKGRLKAMAARGVVKGEGKPARWAVN